ncbi:MAG: lycopene cyclase domain-containing protein [Acidimicrobiia bacterium]|nr:lycopene cyclase domain-containing protein [Acidimicrobiia bacterium]
MDRYQYLLLLAACIAVTLPLEFVVGARVWRRPRRLISVLIVPVLVFMAWDSVSIHRGDWWFSSRFVTGLRVPGNVPVEELVFFIVVPVCGLLTYEAVHLVLNRWRRA